MDGLLLLLLLLGATPDRPVVDTAVGHSRAQAVASVRILRAEVIDFGVPVDRRGVRAANDGHAIFRIAPIRSAAELEGADGRMILLQEFH